jgi:2-C-methyl-D-erythritol 2,4-cyclodiphosphate synthase
VRTGIGFDAHVFADDRPLILGGITIPSKRGLAGHSDADVLCHAVADAVLGAAVLGDIGEHFLSSDPRWEGAASTDFLRRVAGLVERAGLVIVSVDATVILESPQLSPHRDAIRKSIAAALDMEPERVSVKATTTDGMGMTGRGEGAAALAIAVTEPRP